MAHRVPLEDKNEPLARTIPGLRVWNGEAYGPPDAMWALHARRLAVVPLDARQPPIPRTGTPSSVWCQLRDYQQEGVSRLFGSLLTTGGALLADEMGLGKTLQTLETFAQMPAIKNILVVCPKQAVGVWQDEAEKWYPMARVRVLVRKSSKPVEVPPASELKNGWLTVTNYENLEKLPDDYIPNGLVLDEVQYIKNFKAARSRRLAELAGMVPFRLGVSATPFWTSAQDYWHVLTVLFGDNWGSRSRFGFAYAGAKLNQWNGLEYEGATPEAQAELKGRLSFYSVRRTKAEVAKELPPLIRQVVWVDAPTRKAATFLHRVRLGKAGGSTFADALRDAGEAKLDAAVELAVEARRFLCLTYLKEHAAALADRMSKRGLQVRVITGDTPHMNRKLYIKEMEACGGGIVGTIDALTVALNLQKLASVGIMHSIDPIAPKMVQAEARIHRLGSTEPVTWYYLACKESVDKHIVEKVVKRLDQFIGIHGNEAGSEGLRAAIATEERKTEAQILAELMEELG